VPDYKLWAIERQNKLHKLHRPSRSGYSLNLPHCAHLTFESTLQTVLIVDDSINVRRFLALTLERAGYRVEQAKDGQEVWERLESGSNRSGAVICDIEML
jgi:PleD family two-component response regulator